MVVFGTIVLSALTILMFYVHEQCGSALGCFAFDIHITYTEQYRHMTAGLLIALWFIQIKLIWRTLGWATFSGWYLWANATLFSVVIAVGWELYMAAEYWPMMYRHHWRMDAAEDVIITVVTSLLSLAIFSVVSRATDQR